MKNEINIENVERFLQEQYGIEKVEDLFEGFKSDPNALIAVIKEFTHLSFDEQQDIYILEHPMFTDVYLSYEDISPFNIKAPKYLIDQMKDLRATAEADILKQRRLMDLKRIRDWRGKHLDKDR